jgi:hypothetical protein
MQTLVFLLQMHKKYTRAIMVCYPLVQEIRIVCIPHPKDLL